MRLAIITAHAKADSLAQATASWVGDELRWEPEAQPCTGIAFESRPRVVIVNGQRGMLLAYQYGLEWEHSDILAFFHDDLIIHDPEWASRVLAEFEDPTVGLVGFGGATRHGSPELYNAPYDYHQLGRSNFLSNMTDAENHGKRVTGSCDVAVLDGFALIVRREVLEKSDGWPLNTPIGYVCYDYWLSCVTRRLGYRIRLVGVPVTHLGGRTFVKLGIGQDPKHWQQYLDSHEYIYNEFRDVLPYEVSKCSAERLKYDDNT